MALQKLGKSGFDLICSLQFYNLHRYQMPFLKRAQRGGTVCGVESIKGIETVKKPLFQ